jgi:diacylglycerol kinase (ATP)
MSIKIIINPDKQSLNYSSINTTINTIKSYHSNVDVIFTTPDHSEEKIFLAHMDKCKKIIVVGGDGTVNRIITYLLKNNITDIPIGVIPKGTANVFAIEKNIPMDTKKSIKSFFSGKQEYLDIGVIKNSSKKYYFLLMTGIGFDAQTVHTVDTNLKRIIGKAAYLLSAVKNIFQYNPKEIFIKTNEGETFNATDIILSNGKFYAGKYLLAPTANMQDGLLDMCIFQPKNVYEFIHSVSKIKSGLHIESKDIIYKKTSSLKVWTETKHKIPFQYDGEAGDFLPVEISVLHKKLPFIIP